MGARERRALCLQGVDVVTSVLTRGLVVDSQLSVRSLQLLWTAYSWRQRKPHLIYHALQQAVM